MSTTSASAGWDDPLPAETYAVFAAAPGGAPKAPRLRRLCATIPGPTVPSVEPVVRLQVWLAAFLLTKFQEEQDAIWAWIEKNIGRDAGWVPTLYNLIARDDVPPPVVATFGNEYLTVNHAGKVYAVTTGTYHDAVPHTWVRGEVVNLRALYKASEQRMAQWIQKQQPSGGTPTPPPSAS